VEKKNGDKLELGEEEPGRKRSASDGDYKRKALAPVGVSNRD
jgi:hypothetical protein